MLFPTIDFAVFFVVVFTASWLLRPWPKAWKIMILAASYVFYGWWDWRFVFLLAASTVLNQSGALLAVRLPDARWRRWAMIGTVVGDLALLAWFKYYGFLAVNVANALHSAGFGSPLPLMQVALPVGISFFTFMGISYVVDAHRGKVKPAGWLDAAVYLAFFPHLVAGPIVRGSELFPQLRQRRDPRRIDATRAAWLIMAGLAKKIVISSFLARVIVDPVFALPHQHSAIEVLVAVYAYAVQIYADFSGYTDIAIGVALLLGFRFPDNFDAPYTATSLQDFWRRWHITLSTWLRDYLYIPLGGNRGGRWRTARNIMLTMVIGGLWHGAAWTFVAWGALHGGGQALGMARRQYRARRVEGAGPDAAPGAGPDASPGLAPVPVGTGSTASGGTDVPAGIAAMGPAGIAAMGHASFASTAVVDAGRSMAVVDAGRSTAEVEPWPGGALVETVPARRGARPPAARATTPSTGASPARRWLSRLATFHLVCLGWVLFRAESFHNAVELLSRLAHPGRAPLVTPLVLLTIIGSIAAQYVPSADLARLQARLSELSPVTQGIGMASALYLITLLGPVGVAPFIYYRF